MADLGADRMLAHECVRRSASDLQVTMAIPAGAQAAWPLPQDVQLTGQTARTTAASSGSLLDEQDSRPPMQTGSSTSSRVALLQYVPADTEDSLDLVVAECIAYLAIPKRALGYAALHRESPGVYNLGRYRFVLRQLDDGGLYMQQGAQWAPFDAWLLEEARRHMSQLPTQEEEQLDGNYRGIAASHANLASNVQRPAGDSSAALGSQIPYKERESPSSAKVLFPSSPEEKGWDLRAESSQKVPSHACANVEIDVEIDIAADSTGATGTTKGEHD